MSSTSLRQQRETGASARMSTSRFHGPVDVAELEAPRKSKPEIETTLGTLVEPGEYPAYVTVARHYFHDGWKRWMCILKFDLFDANLNCIARNIPMWFALGKGKAPHAGRGSKYFKAWFQANANTAPKRNRTDRLLSPRVFERRMVRVMVRTQETTPPYSVVAEVLSWETGTAEKKEPEKVSAPGRVEGTNSLNPHRREAATSLPQSHWTKFKQISDGKRMEVQIRDRREILRQQLGQIEARRRT